MSSKTGNENHRPDRTAPRKSLLCAGEDSQIAFKNESYRLEVKALRLGFDEYTNRYRSVSPFLMVPGSLWTGRRVDLDAETGSHSGP